VPPNPKNLKPFKPGPDARRNLKGRPKLPDIREAMAKVMSDPVDGMTALEATLEALRNKALAGDVRAAEVLLDRAFGKSAQTVDVTSGGEKIVTPPIVWSDTLPHG
jgi:hypothetical protein